MTDKQPRIEAQAMAARPEAGTGVLRQRLEGAVRVLSAASLMAVPWSLSLAGKCAAVLSLIGWIGLVLKRTRVDDSDRIARRLCWAWALGCIGYLLLHLAQMNATEDWRRLDASSRLLALSGLVFVPGLIRLHLRDLQAPLTVAGLWFGAITLSQYVAHPEQRSFGLYSYENMMGFAAMGNALLLAATIGSGHDRRTVMATIGIVASLGAVVLSGTRGAWPGLLPLLWLLASRRRGCVPAQAPAPARSTAMHRVAVWGVAAAVALAVAVPLKTRLIEAGTDLTHLQHGDQGGSLGMRVMMANKALDMIRAHPWSGNGLSAFNRRIVQWADEIGIHKTAMERGFQNPHNQYLHWALSLGLPAAAACLALIIVFPAWLSWRRNSPDPQARRALRALVFTVPIYFLSEAILDRHHGAQWFSLVWGLLIGMCLQAKSPPASSESSAAP